MLKLDLILKLKSAEYCSCKLLAGYFRISENRIRNEIAEINNSVSSDVAHIASKRGSGNGYELIIHDFAKFEEYLNELEEENKKEQYNFRNTLTRVENIALFLLNQNDYIRLDDLADRFYLSSRQMSTDLRLVRKFYENYNLSIGNLPYRGMFVEGTEFSKRLCMANIYFKNISMGNNGQYSILQKNVDAEIAAIKNIILEESSSFGIEFSDVALDNLTIHLFVTIERAGIEFKNDDREDTEKELPICTAILNRLEDLYHVKFSAYDRRYMGIHIAGKRFYNTHDDLISQDIHMLAEEILKQIDERFLTTYSEDQQLIVRLSLHLIPLIIRIENHFVQTNPMAEDIKSNYKISNEMACVAAEVINKKYNVQLSQDEISYIALHLELSTYMSQIRQYKILLLCHTGTTSSEILKRQIQSRFEDYISELNVSSVAKVNNYELDNYDFILTTIPFRAFTKTPIYRIDTFLNDKSSSKIEDLVRYGSFKQDISVYFPEELFIQNLKAENKESVIHEMVKEIQKYRNISDDFFNQVMEREKLSSTDYGNQVAIPHPFKKMSEEPFTSVAILDHPIRWGVNHVQLVLLTSISDQTKDLQTYYYMLTKTIADEKKVERIISNPTYKNFMKIIDEG